MNVVTQCHGHIREAHTVHIAPQSEAADPAIAAYDGGKLDCLALCDLLESEGDRRASRQQAQGLSSRSGHPA